MKTIGITGGTGFIGHHLVPLLLGSGYRVVIFTRGNNKKDNSNLIYSHWDPAKGECDEDILEELDAIVHLAGAGVADKRWTPERKKVIVSSRVNVTHFLIDQLKQHAPRCKKMIAASATGYYGPDRGAMLPFREEAIPYNDFLANTCRLWEQETHKADKLMQCTIFRFGIVLGKESGAFPELAKPLSFGVMPILGSGRQIVSWIHVDDLCQMLLWALEHDDMAGTYNAVAPHPVTHKKLMRTIGRTKGGLRIPVPVPGFVIKAILGEMSIEVLKSCTVSAHKILHTGFTFRYDSIDKAVKAILK